MTPKQHVREQDDQAPMQHAKHIRGRDHPGEPASRYNGPVIHELGFGRMKLRVLWAIVCWCAAAAHAQTTRATAQQGLGFEQQTGPELKAWWTNPPGTIKADDQVAHTGKWSVRIQRDEKSAGQLSVMAQSLPVDFAGGNVELRGFLRLDDVDGWVGLWMREDGEGEALALENMQEQHVTGTRDWAEYRIALPVKPGAKNLVFGVLMQGTGTAWADDVQLLVDGKPIAEAKTAPPLPGLPPDHEFDAGSKVAITALTPLQVANLAKLARVWGFLKYHDPRVTGGQRHWDYELFRVMPVVLASSDGPQANRAMVAWMDKLGPVADCHACAKGPTGELDLKPELDWIHDRNLLGDELSERLQQVYANRSGKQFFVSFDAEGAKPTFDHEPGYPQLSFPDAGYQLLALFRWWNIVQYWTPGRAVAGEDWPAVLRELIPKLALAKDKKAYDLALFEMVATLNDTHANVWSALPVRPPTGACSLPADVRWVENQAVVWRVNAPTAGVKLGDAITAIDGTAVGDLFAQWRQCYADSNETARMRDMTQTLTRGACGPVKLKLVRGGTPTEVEAARVQVATMAAPWHDRPGEPFQLLSPDVAYLKLEDVKPADVPRIIKKAEGTKGMVIDLRNYPQYLPWVMGPILATKPTPFVSFTSGEAEDPGAFAFRATATLPVDRQHYGGKVVVLVDEVTQSRAEFTAMALRAVGAVVVGSTTAGADGDVAEISLPGGQSTMVSGLGVFYPDHRPTQRVGIVPDVVATPTIKGIAQGRDEVLERAVQVIEGPAPKDDHR